MAQNYALRFCKDFTYTNSDNNVPFVSHGYNNKHFWDAFSYIETLKQDMDDATGYHWIFIIIIMW